MTARRTFVLDRHEDVSHVSGTGEVAEGCVWSDGEVALHWPGKYPTTSTHRSVESVEAIHGHGGKTTVKYDGEQQADSRTPLQRMADYIAAGGEHISLNGSGPYDKHGRVKIHVFGEDAWHSWLDAMGGSPDAAVYEDREGDTHYPRERQWTSSDGMVMVFHLVSAS